MPREPSRNSRYINQARRDYAGKPKRIAWCMDKCGETHVIIEMALDNGDVHYLDWIGADYADQPDEFTGPEGFCGDEVPFSNLKWSYIAKAVYVPDAKET